MRVETTDHRLGLGAGVPLRDGYRDGGGAGFDWKSPIYVQGRNFLENEQSCPKTVYVNVLQQLRKTGTLVPYV